MNSKTTPLPFSPGPWARFERYEPNLLAIGTTVLWLSCLAVGVLGLFIPYPASAPPPLPPPPVQAQIMHVDLTKMIAPAPAPQPTPPSNPSPPQEISLPAAPAAPTAVATPSPALAFAVPITGPVRIVSSNQAVATPITQPQTRTPAPEGTSNQPTHLILGQGEGRQPPPQYPFEAIRQGEQGTVVVRFTVSETGSVLTAEAVVPCPYPLLNQAALQAVRDTWHFVNGPKRSYEVSIQFQLQPR